MHAIGILNYIKICLSYFHRLNDSLLTNVICTPARYDWENEYM